MKSINCMYRSSLNHIRLTDACEVNANDEHRGVTVGYQCKMKR